MASEKLGYEDFIMSVADDCKPFIAGLHQDFTGYGSKIEVKAAKSGYVVSYILNKKTVANYVFRKKGMMVRIYANHINEYMAFLDTLPDEMVKAIQDAPDCKRLINPAACNPKCAMGYDFILHGEHYQKCRNNSFLFHISEESMPFIHAFLHNELKMCSQVS